MLCTYSHTHVIEHQYLRMSLLWILLLLCNYSHAVIYIVLSWVEYITWCQKRDKRASYQLQPPAPFAFKCPDEQAKWKRKFGSASGLSANPSTKQVHTAVCHGRGCGGDPTVLPIQQKSILTTLKWSRSLTPSSLFQRIFKYARFNNRCQADGESVEQFITSMYNLADSYEFRDQWFTIVSWWGSMIKLFQNAFNSIQTWY